MDLGWRARKVMADADEAAGFEQVGGADPFLEQQPAQARGQLAQRRGRGVKGDRLRTRLTGG